MLSKGEIWVATNKEATPYANIPFTIIRQCRIKGYSGWYVAFKHGYEVICEREKVDVYGLVKLKPDEVLAYVL